MQSGAGIKPSQPSSITGARSIQPQLVTNQPSSNRPESTANGPVPAPTENSTAGTPPARGMNGLLFTQPPRQNENQLTGGQLLKGHDQESGNAHVPNTNQPQDASRQGAQNTHGSEKGSSQPSQLSLFSFGNQNQRFAQPNGALRQPYSQEAAVVTPSCGFDESKFDSLDEYINSQKLVAILATKEFNKISADLSQPHVREKLVINLAFYRPNQVRQSFYSRAIEPKIMEHMARNLPQRRSLRVHPGVERMLRLVVQTVSRWMGVDILLAYYFTQREMVESGFVNKFLDGRSHLGELQRYVIECGSEALLCYEQPEIESILQNACRAIAEDRKTLLKILQDILTFDKAFKSIARKLIHSGLPLKLCESYLELSRQTYKVEQNAVLQSYLNEQIAKEQFKVTKLLIEICRDETIDSTKVIDARRLVKLLDEQQLSGSSLRLGLEKSSAMVSAQHYLLLRILPITQALLKKSNQNSSDSSWDQGLYDTIRETKSEQMLPYRSILPRINGLYGGGKWESPGVENMDSLCRTVKGCQWKDWLELWVDRQNVSDPSKLDFTILLLKGVMRNSLEGFGRKECRGIQQLWADLFAVKNYSRAFEVLSTLAVSQDRETTQHMLELLNRHDPIFLHSHFYRSMSKLFFDFRQNGQTVANSSIQHYQPLKFLCKCTCANPSSINQLEAMLLGRTPGPVEGCFFIMFLLDSIRYFSVLNSLKSLKWLFRAVTALLKDLTTMHKVAVCLSCQTFEDRDRDTKKHYMEIICQRLKGRQSLTHDEIELTKAVLQSLIATLAAGTNDKYFETPNSHFSNDMPEQTQRILSRHTGQYYTDVFRALLKRQYACSDWLSSLMRVLEVRPIAASYEATNLLLQRLVSQFNEIKDPAYRLLQKGIQSLNQSSLSKELLGLFEVCRTQNIRSSEAVILGYTNRLLAESANDGQAKEQLYQGICLLNTLLKLLLVKNNSETKPNVQRLLESCDLVLLVEEKLGGRLGFYEYRCESMTLGGWVCENVSIVRAIISLLHVEYVPTQPNVSLPPYNDSRDLADIRRLIQIVDLQLLHDPLYRPLYHGYLRHSTLYIQVLRCLTQLIILWDMLPALPKPSLSKILDDRPINHIRLDSFARSPMERLWKLIIDRLHFSLQEFPETLITSFDLINTCLVYDTRFFEMVGCRPESSLLERLKEFIKSTATCRWKSNHLICVSKMLLTLELAIEKSASNPEVKRCAEELVFKDSLLQMLVSAIPSDYAENIRPSISPERGVNLLRELDIYEACMYYNSLAIVIRLHAYAILSGRSRSPTTIAMLLSHLYSESMAVKFSSHSQYSSELEPLMEDLWRHRSSDEQVAFQNELTHSYEAPDSRRDSQQQDVRLKEKLHNLLEINDYGYGRFYEVNIHKAYEHLAADQLRYSQVEGLMEKISRYNCLRSLQEVKQSALSSWACLYSVISSIGQDGYSFSDRLGKPGAVSLRQLESEFPSHMCLVNSKQIVLESEVRQTHAGRSSAPSTKSLFVCLCNWLARVLPDPPNDFLQESARQLMNRRNQGHIATQLLMVAQLAFRNQLQVAASEQQQRDFMVFGLTHMLPILEKTTLVIPDCFQIKSVCAMFSMLCVVAHRLGPSHSHADQLCSWALVAYKNADLNYRNVMIIAASPLFAEHRVPDEFCRELVKETTKHNFEFKDFFAGATVLQVLALKDPRLLEQTSFFSQIKNTLQNIELNRSEADSYFHKIFSVLLRLSACALLSERLNERVPADIQSFLLSFEDYIREILTVSDKKKFDDRFKFKLTSMRLRQNEYIISVLTLLMKQTHRRVSEEWINSIIEMLLYGGAFSAIHRLIGYDPQGEEVRLAAVIPHLPKSLTGQPRPYDPELRRSWEGSEDHDLFTLMCNLRMFKALQAFFLFLQVLMEIGSMEAHWQQIEKTLSAISRWIVVKCQNYLATERLTGALLSYHCAYVRSADHAVKSNLMDQSDETYTFKEFMGMLGGVSYSCHALCIRFVGCMKLIQGSHYKDFDLSSFQKQLLSDADRSAHTFRYYEPDIQRYLELPQEHMPLWSCLMERIKYQQY